MNKEKTIQINSKIVRNNKIISSDMDGETVMMSIENGEYYGINPIGSRIWELLEHPVTLSEICELLLKKYDVDANQCQTEVLKFANHLFEKKLIRYG